MLLNAVGSAGHNLSSHDIRKKLAEAFDRLGKKEKVLIIPPDFTRFHSRAGEITSMIYEFYQESIADILPALGTHKPMTREEMGKMFPGIPQNLFRVHDWRKDVVRIGEIPEEIIRKVSNGAVSYPWPVEINRRLWEGGHDLIISVGQVVPHEVIGMANFNKNIFIGCGGPESINKSHFLGAVYGMEKLMGRAENPVREVLNLAGSRFLAKLPILYILTVQEPMPGSFQSNVAPGKAGPPEMITRGLFIGTDEDTFMQASELSARVNNTLLDTPLQKVVVWLDPDEYRSTWVGNKSIYRTRMAIADGGELVIIAPGIREFGEDGEIDRLIRKYGYKGTGSTLGSLANNKDLEKNLSAAAHLIHGSSEGRFRITYCPGYLSANEIEEAGYHFADWQEMYKRYLASNPATGYNFDSAGEEYYYIDNPATGLWTINC